jgi:8-oxo-dGTP pyrophosphatase MutT (NUDIX family)
MAAIAAMKALVVRNGKFLALELEIGRSRIWDLPGGKVEDGEEPMQTLLREVKEETALDISPGKPVGVYHFLRKTDGLQAVCTVFKAEVGEDAKVILPHKSNESIASNKWLSKEEFLGKEFDAPKSLKELVEKNL